MKKIISLAIVSGLTIFLFFRIAGMYAPGSYPYAETYELNVDEKTLIGAIDSFKKKNNKYNLPEQIQLKDGRSDSF